MTDLPKSLTIGALLGMQAPDDVPVREVLIMLNSGEAMAVIRSKARYPDRVRLRVLSNRGKPVSDDMTMGELRVAIKTRCAHIVIDDGRRWRISMTDLSPDAQRAIRQVEKLLRLAAKHPTEAEGIAAANKAQELLTAYNLDLATVERGSDSGKREDAKMKGGLYHYQRDLWEAVAELNFCLYWNQYVFNPDKRGRRRDRYGTVHRTNGGHDFVHRVVGRTVNVVATRVMSEYLEQTIERLTRERLDGDGSQFFTRWAISYREGIAERVIEKIYERRRAQLRKEAQEAREAEKRAAEAAMAPASSATTLTVSSYSKSEREANIDVVMGEGWSAKRAAERAEAARVEAEAEAAYTAWAKANPEEAQKAAEEERKVASKRRYSAGRASYRDTKARDYGAYKAGHEAGAGVSIDLQAGKQKTAGLL